MNRPQKSLLKIDVTLEIEKLTRHRFKSTTEWAVCLCRYLVGLGATGLEIEIKNGVFCVYSKDASVAADDLALLNIAFHQQHELSARHRAIVQIEASSSFDLLSAFYLKNAKVQIGAGKMKLTVSNGKQAKLEPIAERIAPNSQRNGTQIQVLSRKIRAHNLEQVLCAACRYAALPIIVNRRRISEGKNLADCFVQQPFTAGGVSGVVGIPLDTDFVRQITLRHGIVLKDVLRQPAFGLIYHVIADSADEIDELRHLRSVVRNVYLSLGQKLDTFSGPLRRRAIEVLFGRFLETRDKKYIANVRAFEHVDGRHYTLSEVHQLALRGPVFAIPPQTDVRWLCGGRHTFVLDARQWNFLESEIGQVITAPPSITAHYAAGGRKSNQKMNEMPLCVQHNGQSGQSLAERVMQNLT